MKLHTFIKKFLSFLVPMHIAHVHTEKNGVVELCYYNGKKLLNTPNTNYSYGLLQAILRFGLKKINVTHISTVLLLGLGGGSVIETLRKEFHHQHKIVAVDFDAHIIAIAQEEYNIKNDENLEIIHDDAQHFVRTNTETYSTVIVDLSIDNQVPDFVYSIDFWKHIYERVESHGSVLCNAAITKSYATKMQDVLEYLNHVFDVDVYEYPESTNTIFVARKQV